jgi:hypothetical protein
MLIAARAADEPACFVAAYESYGGDAAFRAGMHALGRGHMFAVARTGSPCAAVSVGGLTKIAAALPALLLASPSDRP